MQWFLRISSLILFLSIIVEDRVKVHSEKISVFFFFYLDSGIGSQDPLVFFISHRSPPSIWVDTDQRSVVCKVDA